MILRLIRIPGRFGSVVSFDDRTALKGSQNLVTACNNLVTLFDPTEDFDVCCAGDTGGDGDEDSSELVFISAVRLEQVDALNERRLAGRRRLRGRDS